MLGRANEMEGGKEDQRPAGGIYIKNGDHKKNQAEGHQLGGQQGAIKGKTNRKHEWHWQRVWPIIEHPPLHCVEDEVPQEGP